MSGNRLEFKAFDFEVAGHNISYHITYSPDKYPQNSFVSIGSKATEGLKEYLTPEQIEQLKTVTDDLNQTPSSPPYDEQRLAGYRQFIQSLVITSLRELNPRTIFSPNAVSNLHRSDGLELDLTQSTLHSIITLLVKLYEKHASLADILYEYSSTPALIDYFLTAAMPNDNLALAYKLLFELIYVHDSFKQYENIQKGVNRQFAAFIPTSQAINPNDFINLTIISRSGIAGLADHIAASPDTFETAEEYDQAIKKIKEAYNFWNNSKLDGRWANRWATVKNGKDHLCKLRNTIHDKIKIIILNVLTNHFTHHRYIEAWECSKSNVFFSSEAMYNQLYQAKKISNLINNGSFTDENLLAALSKLAPIAHAHLLEYVKEKLDDARYAQYISYVKTKFTSTLTSSFKGETFLSTVSLAFNADSEEIRSFDVAPARCLAILKSYQPYLAQVLTDVNLILRTHHYLADREATSLYPAGFDSASFFSNIIAHDKRGISSGTLFECYFLSGHKLSPSIAPALISALERAKASGTVLPHEQRLMIDAVHYTRAQQLVCKTLTEQYARYLQTWQYQSNADGTDNYAEYTQQLNAAYKVAYHDDHCSNMRKVLRDTYLRILFEKVEHLKATDKAAEALVLLKLERTNKTLNEHREGGVRPPDSILRMDIEIDALNEIVFGKTAVDDSIISSISGAFRTVFISPVTSSLATLFTHQQARPTPPTPPPSSAPSYRKSSLDELS